MDDRTITEKITCSGALFCAKSTQRFLLLQKAHGKHVGTWGLVGGTNISGESPWQGLQREIEEEIGTPPYIKKTLPLEKFTSNDSVFNFHTYLCVVQDEFIPLLSHEHDGWAWANLDNAPKPLHQGLRNSFSNTIMKTKLQTIFDLINLI